MLKKQTKDISKQRKVPHSGELDEDKEEATAGLAGMFKMLLGGQWTQYTARFPGQQYTRPGSGTEDETVETHWHMKSEF